METPEDGRKPRPVRGYNYSRVAPTAIEQPFIGALSEPCMQMIGLSQERIRQMDKTRLAEFLCGNKTSQGCVPLSHCYCGYQFGHFSG